MNRTEQNRTEQNRTEQNRTEQNRTEQNIIPNNSVNIYKQNLYQELVEVLSADDRLVSEGKLIKNKVVELSLNLDSSLLKHLIKNTSLKKHFFSDIDGTLIFDKIKFQKFVNNKQFLPDSYTSFKNKIGLVSNGEYLSESKDVVLAFPYKDCVLEGGQDKEDAKREEVFWNETLASDQIDRLLSPKVLTNFKRYTKDSKEQVTSFNENDNLIIKGNNLIALHTILNKYRGKVKLIYIDPPYNTGSDSFKYNDSFNHSTWLTFMKNRFEVARKFLKENGIICVQCSFHEFAYIKIVMDEIFPKCLVALNIQVRHSDRILNGDKEYNDVIEYILIYSNTSSAKMPKRIEEKTDDEYIYSVKEIGNPEIIYLDKKRVEIYTPEKYALITQKPNKLLTKK